MKNKLLSVVFVVIIFAQSTSFAVDKKGQDFIRGKLFLPEVILQNQKKLGLTDEQKKQIKNQIKDTQDRVNDLQWELQYFSEELTSVIEKYTVDEEKALASMGKMLETENQIKMHHMKLLIRMKRVLEKEQIELLRKITK